MVRVHALKRAKMVTYNSLMFRELRCGSCMPCSATNHSSVAIAARLAKETVRYVIAARERYNRLIYIKIIFVNAC
jgi:hypothetical protein